MNNTTNTNTAAATIEHIGVTYREITAEEAETIYNNGGEVAVSAIEIREDMSHDEWGIVHEAQKDDIFCADDFAELVSGYRKYHLNNSDRYTLHFYAVAAC